MCIVDEKQRDWTAIGGGLPQRRERGLRGCGAHDRESAAEPAGQIGYQHVEAGRIVIDHEKHR